MAKPGHTLVVTSDKDGPDSVFERELMDADVAISQPFWPAYLTEDRIAKAKKLKLAITAGIGSDHVDLQAAMNRDITVVGGGEKPRKSGAQSVPSADRSSC
jgi:formate dehydrogenase